MAEFDPEPEAEFDTLAAGEDLQERKETPWGFILVGSGLALAALIILL